MTQRHQQTPIFLTNKALSISLYHVCHFLLFFAAINLWSSKFTKPPHLGVAINGIRRPRYSKSSVCSCRGPAALFPSCQLWLLWQFNVRNRTHICPPGLVWAQPGSPDSLLIEYAGRHTGTTASDQKWHHLVKGHDPVQNHAASRFPAFPKRRVMLHCHVQSLFNYFHLGFVCLYLPLDHMKSRNTWVGRPAGHQGSGSTWLETQITHVEPKCTLPHT